MKVPMLDLGAQYEDVGKQIEKEVIEVLRSRNWVLGPVVRSFEEEMEEYTGCTHAVGLASGSDALLLALQALDVGEGTEVITTPFSFFATVSSITRLGATPVFCDIDAATCNLDPQAVKCFLEEKCEQTAKGTVNKSSGQIVKAILPVHLYGQTADMQPLLDIASAYDLEIVEDAAQALSSRYRNGETDAMAGSMGAIGCYSFYPSKNLGGVGDGGMAVTNREELAIRLKRLRNHGDAGYYDHQEVGINSRLDAIQAAALSVKLRWLDTWSKLRIGNAKAYVDMFESKGLLEKVQLPVVEHENLHIYNQFTIHVDRRDELVAHMRSMDVGCAVYYPIPLHLQACFAYLGVKEGNLPVAEKVATRCLSLPIYPEMDYVMQRKVVDEIAAFIGKG